MIDDIDDGMPLYHALEMPEMTFVLLKSLMLRLGGQVMLTEQELSASQEYFGIRIAMDKHNNTVTLTLRTGEGKALGTPG